MAHDDRITQQSPDPHGYQPLFVDERCLTPQERADVLTELVSHRASPECVRAWARNLSVDELAEFVAPCHPDANYWLDDESPVQLELNFRKIVLGMSRDFARRKYSGGRCAWFGDGPAPWLLQHH